MSFFDHIIHGIEVAGNKLPNPFVLFVMVWIFMIVLSQILAGVSAIDPASGETVVVEGMLNADGLKWVLKNMVSNYTKFSPLGTVLVMMIGLGVTTTSGLLNEAMKKSCEGTGPLARISGSIRRNLRKYRKRRGVCNRTGTGSKSVLCSKERSNLWLMYRICRCYSRIYSKSDPDGNRCPFSRSFNDSITAC